MPFVDSNGVRLHYRLDGPEDGPVLALSNSLGTSLEMWQAQMPRFASAFRVVRMDTRGHGQSDAPAGEYDLANLAGDVLRVLDTLGIDRARFCGISMGGLIGAWLGAHASERIERLVLCNTAAKIGTADSWNARIASIRDSGMAEIVNGAPQRWFTAAFRERAPGEVAAVQAQIRNTPPGGYTGCCAAIRDADLRGDLEGITAPTLVVVGRHDPATPPAEGRALADGIARAQLLELDASHLSNIEAADAFNDGVLSFLTTQGETTHG
ncbi:MAG TPA: 3-oxoadipate enol-lactonase [Gammaproteobacteria bacterium]|nr:3-oxoadipate enol-lactonase [Gammaproteobacteria bacterium]